MSGFLTKACSTRLSSARNFLIRPRPFSRRCQLACPFLLRSAAGKISFSSRDPLLPRHLRRRHELRVDRRNVHGDIFGQVHVAAFENNATPHAIVAVHVSTDHVAIQPRHQAMRRTLMFSPILLHQGFRRAASIAPAISAATSDSLFGKGFFDATRQQSRGSCLARARKSVCDC